MRRKQVLVSMLAVGLGLLLTLVAGLALAQGPGPAGYVEMQAVPVGTAFTYQGRLTDGGNPANGSYDFEFKLYDAASGGTWVGTVTKEDVTVTDGLFTVVLDFGSGAFTGDARWLEIGVRPGASTGAYTTLTPRQALTPAPYALALPGLWTQPNATSPNLIGGFSGNSITGGVVGAAISGGGTSGKANRVTDEYGTVGGGAGNQAGDNGGTTYDATYATVGGGFSNTASRWSATVGGGGGNLASGSAATVGGGRDNTASGKDATVPGGQSNTAQGDYSFAAGRYARANHQGAFVWADSTSADFASTANDQFAVRANGGVTFSTGGASFRINGGDAWTSANDGAGSGLDADLLDGQDSSHYLDTLRGLSCSNGQVAKWNASTSRWECANDQTGAGGDFWSLTGNAGTNPATNFLGSTDNQALELRVNSARALRLEPNATSPNLIGGYSGNSVTPTTVGATIGGGGAATLTNRVTDNWGTVGGGQANRAGDDAAETDTASYATIGGGYNNIAGNWAAIVGGGSSNTASGNYATVGGGQHNTASGYIAAVSGGDHNTASGDYATVGGGYYIAASGYAATVGGGGVNTASGSWATVGGGVSNTASGDYAAVAGGQNNLASHNYATVSGGQNNTASNSHATVGGGSGNTASNRWATVGGGYLNTASGDVATISGGYGNTASNYATVGGGIYNHAEGPYATVAGGDANTASGNYAIVGGGYGNLAAADYATIAGGGYSDPGSFTGHNRVTDNYGTIGGGGNNQAGDAAGTTDDAPYATVGGGRQNTASDDYTTIGGGRNNTASSQHATVGGGINNTASGTRATVGGGEANMASGYRSIVPGGVSNWALGDHSFAAGRRAKANHQGTFVWGDSTDADVASTGNNQFIVRASGGVYLYTSSDLSTGVYLAPGSGSWTPIPVPSDRNLKENFTPVDGQEMLARLAEIPITTWNYKSQDPAVRHIGPMAQDFYAAFSLGEDDEHISTVDADGVTLAAIQGLYQLLQEKEAQVASLSSQVASQQTEIDDLGTRLAALEQQSAIRNPQPVLSRAEGSAIPWLLLAGVAVGSVWLTQRRRGGQ